MKLPICAGSRPLDDKVQLLGGVIIAKSYQIPPEPSKQLPVAFQLPRTFGVRSVDACIEQATPRAWEGNQNGNVRGGLDDVGDLVIPTFGEIVLLGDIDNFTKFGIRIRLLHVPILIGAKQHHCPLRSLELRVSEVVSTFGVPRRIGLVEPTCGYFGCSAWVNYSSRNSLGVSS